MFLTKIVAALVHFDVYAAVALLVSTVYWVRDNAPLLLYAKQSRKSTNTNTQIQIQILVWSILMFIVYAAIALLADIARLTPCKTQYTIEAKNKWKSASAKN